MQTDDNISDNNLTNVLDTLGNSMKGERVKVGKVLDSLNEVGVGPLLLVPAFLVISPIGAIPGACAVLGMLIFLISLQVVLGRSDPFFPQSLKNISIRSKNLRRAIRKMKPYAAKGDRHLSSHLAEVANNALLQRATALVCMILAVGIMFTSLIPFAPTLLALPIILFSLGLSVQNTFLIFTGHGLLILAILITPVFFFGGAQ